MENNYTMRILVTAKRVVDYRVRVRVKADGSQVDTNNLKMSINPFDEIAIEQAVQFKEAGIATEVIVVSIGDDKSEETLRHALALGADRAILVKSTAHLESLHIAKYLQAIINDEKPDLVIMGKQSIDNDANQAGQMLAELLNWPQATFACNITVNEKLIEVQREVDGGLETLKMNLPAVVTTDLRLNEPRYASLPNIMQAKSKPMTITTPEELGVTCKSHITLLDVKPVKTKRSPRFVASAAELIDCLHTQAKVL